MVSPPPLATDQQAHLVVIKGQVRTQAAQPGQRPADQGRQRCGRAPGRPCQQRGLWSTRQGGRLCQPPAWQRGNRPEHGTPPPAGASEHGLVWRQHTHPGRRLQGWDAHQVQGCGPQPLRLLARPVQPGVMHRHVSAPSSSAAAAALRQDVCWATECCAPGSRQGGCICGLLLLCCLHLQRLGQERANLQRPEPRAQATMVCATAVTRCGTPFPWHPITACRELQFPPGPHPGPVGAPPGPAGRQPSPAPAQ